MTKPLPRTSMPGTVGERIGAFRPNVRPLLLALHVLVKDGVYTAESIVDAGLFAGTSIDKKGTRVQKIRAMQAFVDIVTLPQDTTP